MNKTNRSTEFQIYWYYDLHVSGSLSAHHQEFLDVHRHWYILCSFDDRLLPGVGWNILLLVANGHSSFDDRLLPGAGWNILLLVTNGHQNCIKCTNADVRLRTPDDGRKGCPKHVDRNTNKFGIQCVCWFYSQGIFYDARVYDPKKRHI